MGCFGRTNNAAETMDKATAREKLELVLMQLATDKYSDETYNEGEYINEKLEEQEMHVTGDFVSVDKWEFEIDRSVPKIVSDGNIKQDINGNESLIGKMSTITKSGNYDIVLNKKTGETTQEIKYPVHAIEYKGDLVLDGIQAVEGATLTSNVYEFGDKETDVAIGNENAKYMVVLKVDGDLTICENVTLTSCKSDNGYGGPKGLLIYCTGTLTNNGTISMTARGAKAEGEDVYLWQNNDGSYEYVPATGGKGGEKVPYYDCHGLAGTDGINRGTRWRRLWWFTWKWLYNI